jgi:MFS family permease
MRSIIGLLWALAGAVAGFVTGAIVATAIAAATNMSDREGARAYAMVGVGLIGAVIGIVVALVLYARSAPAGQGAAFAGRGVLGIASLVLLVVVAVWAFMNLREAPLEYDGAMATLELELRIPSAEIPPEASASWLDIEVQTTKTRPVATVFWSKRRVEQASTVVPAVQQPLYRAAQRAIVVRIVGRHDELFAPRMGRTPDPRADWSDWVRPTTVAPPYGTEPATPPQSIVELRYRVRPYGE